jgi:hypothetical protein
MGSREGAAVGKGSMNRWRNADSDTAENKQRDIGIIGRTYFDLVALTVIEVNE